jgi:hypothetical protein
MSIRVDRSVYRFKKRIFPIRLVATSSLQVGSFLAAPYALPSPEPRQNVIGGGSRFRNERQVHFFIDDDIALHIKVSAKTNFSYASIANGYRDGEFAGVVRQVS